MDIKQRSSDISQNFATQGKTPRFLVHQAVPCLSKGIFTLSLKHTENLSFYLSWRSFFLW